MILRISLRPELDIELVAFHGELDAASAPDLRARLDEVVEMPRGALLIDLCDCTFIDSLGVAAVGLGVVAVALRRMARGQRSRAASSPRTPRP